MVGIQGPMAAGPMAAGPMAGGPMGGAAGMYPPNMDEGRTQSYRVFGVVIALVTLVCGALLATVLLVVVAVYNNNQPDPLPPVVAGPVSRPAPIDPVDSGLDGGPVQVKPVRPVFRPKPRPSGPKPKPVPKPEASGGGAADQPGRLVVNIPTDMRVTKIEVTCGGSFRARAPVTNGKAVMEGVPAQDCKITFRGGSVTSKFNGRGGKTYTCVKLGTSQLACK